MVVGFTPAAAGVAVAIVEMLVVGGNEARPRYLQQK